MHCTCAAGMRFRLIFHRDDLLIGPAPARTSSNLTYSTTSRSQGSAMSRRSYLLTPTSILCFEVQSMKAKGLFLFTAHTVTSFSCSRHFHDDNDILPPCRQTFILPLGNCSLRIRATDMAITAGILHGRNENKMCLPESARALRHDNGHFSTSRKVPERRQ